VLRAWRVPLAVRERIVSLRADGLSFSQIERATSTSAGTVAMVLKAAGALGRVERHEWAGRLSLQDRTEICAGIERGESCAAIGRRLGWHPSTISREIARHSRSGRAGYQPFKAHRRAVVDAGRPHRTKLASNPVLLGVVTAWLEQLWSPQQIARRLREEFPERPEMWVSHETIYQSLYVQGRGELRRELARCLRSGRAQRRPRRPDSTAGKIPGMINISQRPADAADRAVPGHWEGDLIMGAGNRSAVGTLVERTTRYVMLLHLAEGRSAEQVRQAMAAKILELPESLRRSITWDQGKEMAQHHQFRIDTGVQIYFADPHSPWQRGSNENTNGLLRQYLPKSTDLSRHSEADLDAIADSLNGRPRMTLSWRTPTEALTATIDALMGVDHSVRSWRAGWFRAGGRLALLAPGR
jgi:transposase, IS30 family